MAQRRTFNIPRVWPDQATADGFPAHVEALLRAQAVDAGEVLIGEAVLIGAPVDGGIANTQDGPVETIYVTYEAPTARGTAISEVTVQAAEAEPGVWEAHIPAGVVIVNIKHGLDTLDVQALPIGGGFRSFVPIARDEVSIVASPTTRTVRIERVPEPEPVVPVS